MTEYATDRLTDKPENLPDIDVNGNTALRRWRASTGMNHKQAARRIGVSVATYYRYEAGMQLNMRKANEIVHMTGGKVRYRDLVANFIPEYA